MCLATLLLLEGTFDSSTIATAGQEWTKCFPKWSAFGVRPYSSAVDCSPKNKLI
jgi:hypothetical protein